MAELKIQEYMRQKLEREKQIQLEKQLAREEKEKEYIKILQRQQKLLESQTERNELEYRRQREEVERDFRRREKEAAIRKREMAEEIAKARSVQLEEVVSHEIFTINNTKNIYFLRCDLIHPPNRKDTERCRSHAMRRISRNLWISYVRRRIVKNSERNCVTRTNTNIVTIL